MICPKCGSDISIDPNEMVWSCPICKTAYGKTDSFLEVNTSEKELTIEFICIGLPDFLKSRIMMNDADEYRKDFVDTCNKLAKETLALFDRK